MLVDVLFVLDQLVLELLLQVEPLAAGLRQTVDGAITPSRLLALHLSHAYDETGGPHQSDENHGSLLVPHIAKIGYDILNVLILQDVRSGSHH